MIGPLDRAERAAAAAVLARAWGEPVTVTGAEIVAERHHVVRVTTGDGRTAILKRPRRAGDSGWGGEPDGLAVEWAALDVLGTLAADPPVAPRLLGGDDATGIVVMDELPPARSLADTLLAGDAARARDDLVAYARALATLHATTLGRTGELAEARARRGLAPAVRSWWLRRLDLATPWFVASSAEPEAVAAELAHLGDVLASHYLGLVHGDPCPDNTAIVGGRCLLIDFERAGAGSVALDAGYLVAPFPSCWCFGRLRADAGVAALEAYEATLAGAGVPLGGGWARALAAALGLWAVARLSDYADRDGRDTWGTTTGRPRLAAWTAAFLAAPGAAEFPRVAAAVAAWRDRRDLAGVLVPGYPALAEGVTPPGAGGGGG